jgi:hypothetical protein
MPYHSTLQQQLQQPLGMQGLTDLSQMDPNAYMSSMSPMDLYDSIFWGKQLARDENFVGHVLTV